MLEIGEEFKQVLKNELKTEIITNEIKPTNDFVDGKNVYVKRVYFGNLPNTTTKSVPSGVDFSNKLVTKIEAIGKIDGSNIYFPIPNTNPVALNFGVNITLNSNDIIIATGTDRSTQVAWVTIYFINNN